MVPARSASMLAWSEGEGNDATGRQAGAEAQRGHGLPVIDLESNAGVEQQAEGQDQISGDGIVRVGMQFGGKYPLAVLPGLMLRQCTALGDFHDLTKETPVAIGSLKRGRPARKDGAS